MFIKQESLRVDKRAKNLSHCGDNMEDFCQSKVNYNNHYHLGERKTTAINIMSGVRSLICDLNGIIIAEMVYRCMICDVLFDTIPEVQMHYQSKHIDEDNQNNQNCSTNTSFSFNANTSNTTNVSFFGSFCPSTDINLDNASEPSPPSPTTCNTLTFDVPSGLKTLQQQFQTEKQKEFKKKNIKPYTSTPVNQKSKTALANKPKGQIMNSQMKSGFITCEICNATKFYKYVQRRYGVYSCVGCAKFYSKYLLKPVHYTCENLGKCNLKVSECEPNGRCKACLIHKCKSKFIIDPKKLANANRIGLNISRSNGKKVLNIKTKKYNKPNAGKDLSRTLKGKSSSNSSTIDSKVKTNITLNKAKITTDDSLVSNKVSNTLISTKKAKPEKPIQKLIPEKNDKNGIPTKSSPTTNGITKTSVDKTSISGRGKRNSVPSFKSSSVKNMKRTRQTSCHKCFGCKTKDCNNCVNCLDRPRNGGRDKIRQKCIKRRCLNRSRNS